MVKVKNSLLTIQRLIRKKIEQKELLRNLLEYSQYEFEFCYTYTIIKMYGRLSWLCGEEIKNLILIKVDCYDWYDYHDKNTIDGNKKSKVISTLVKKLYLTFNWRYLYKIV